MSFDLLLRAPQATRELEVKWLDKTASYQEQARRDEHRRAATKAAAEDGALSATAEAAWMQQEALRWAAETATLQAVQTALQQQVPWSQRAVVSVSLSRDLSVRTRHRGLVREDAAKVVL